MHYWNNLLYKTKSVMSKANKFALTVLNIKLVYYAEILMSSAFYVHERY